MNYSYYEFMRYHPVYWTDINSRDVFYAYKTTIIFLYYSGFIVLCYSILVLTDKFIIPGIAQYSGHDFDDPLWTVRHKYTFRIIYLIFAYFFIFLVIYLYLSNINSFFWLSNYLKFNVFRVYCEECINYYLYKSVIFILSTLVYVLFSLIFCILMINIILPVFEKYIGVDLLRPNIFSPKVKNTKKIFEKIRQDVLAREDALSTDKKNDILFEVIIRKHTKDGLDYILRFLIDGPARASHQEFRAASDQKWNEMATNFIAMMALYVWAARTSGSSYISDGFMENEAIQKAFGDKGANLKKGTNWDKIVLPIIQGEIAPYALPSSSLNFKYCFLHIQSAFDKVRKGQKHTRPEFGIFWDLLYKDIIKQ